jgi:hypothetical protein
MAADKADSAVHGDRCTDRIAANIGDTANTVDTDPNMDRNREHRPAPEGREYPRRAEPAV